MKNKYITQYSSFLNNGNEITIEEYKYKDPISENDIIDFLNIFNDEDILRNAYGRENAKKYIIDDFDEIIRIEYEKYKLMWLFIRCDGKIIGFASLKDFYNIKTNRGVFLNYGILKEYRGLGIGTMVINYIKDLVNKTKHINEFFYGVFDYNTPSIIVAKKCGLVLTAVTPKHIYLNNRWNTLLRFIYIKGYSPDMLKSEVKKLFTKYGG